jgi:glutathione synthase/RimK-type ligase-like ATP-grasp enzyme
MIIAIHNSKNGFHPRWVDYCERNSIPYKLVDCYDNNIIEEIKDCDALMWHFHQGNLKDNLIAKQMLFALEQSGLIVFPNFNTSWHFDDKIGQMYLLQSIEAPMVSSFLFFDHQDAINWISQTNFPKVFKLRGGAGSQNVKLIRNKFDARRIVNKAFSGGFSKYDSWGSLKERIYKFKRGKAGVKDVLKAIVRLVYKPEYARKSSKEVGYVYFQDFIANNDSDIRIIVIAKRAFGLKRFVRDGDFRASGSGKFAYDRELFDEEAIRIAFEVNQKLGLQIGVYDFIFNEAREPLIVEVSYGYSHEAYDKCPGYWDDNLNWHTGLTIKEDWMVELIVARINEKNSN